MPLITLCVTHALTCATLDMLCEIMYDTILQLRYQKVTGYL